MMIPHLSWLLLLLPALVASTTVGKLFDRLPTNPKPLIFANEIEINNKGGHLQGVQRYFFKAQEYLFLSGSSSTYGYLAVAHQGKVRKLHRLMFKPFKHAGGFQIHQDWLAVGIEDNEARNTSVVHVYKLADPLVDLPAPLGVIERSGEWERATAGAVAISQRGQTLWVVVGDWGNRHMDYYRADLRSSSAKLEFQRAGEVDMVNGSRKDWIDPVARAYQNINLFVFENQLYLAGFAGDEPSGDNVLDVFTVDLDSASPVITKVYSRRFAPIPTTKFRWGAGMSFDGGSHVAIYACGDNIRKTVEVAVYR